jgi:tetratricopeptide (TPR) repeat protein
MYLLLLFSLFFSAIVSAQYTGNALESAPHAPRAAGVKTDDRIKTYERLIAASPTSLPLKNKLAALYIQKTRETSDYSYLERADKLLAQVLATDPKEYEARRLKNLVEMNRHNFTIVAASARELSKIAPKDTQNWGTLGDALMEMGEYKEAGEAFQKMVDLRPNMFSYNRLAYYRFVTGDAAGAITMMSQAAQDNSLYPENKAWYLVELGNLYFKTGKWAEAERTYRTAIETFSGSHGAHAGLGSALAAQGRIAEAIESYKRAQSITPLPQYAGALSDLYALAGNKEESRKQVEMVDVAAKLEKAANQKANRTLAILYANQERNLPEALALAEADLKVRKDVYTWDALAWALYKNKKLEQARQASSEALKAGTPEALFYYHAGMIARAAGDPAEAEKLLEKALALNSRFDPRQAQIAQTTLQEIAARASATK